ncbi:MAG TPA: DnaJ family domain-containing protein [Desulfosporosinus sp.]
MKDFYSILTERRIQEALARGDDKNLTGTGKPLKVESLHFLPQKLRAAYIVLKNSGYLEQVAKDKNCFLPPSTSDDLNIHNVDPSILKQELSEELLKYNVMMDCRRKL